MIDRRGIVRFVRYTIVGVTTFLGDLALLAFLLAHTSITYVPASVCAYLCAVSVNYAVSRRVVFRGTMQGVGKGYVSFVSLAVCGAALVAGGMMLGVEWLGLHPLIARVVVAGMVGTTNYLANLYFTFRVAGVHVP